MVQSAQNDPLLSALADHLRVPLLQIARLSELGSEGALSRIGLISEQALRLVDAYTMSKDQLKLELEPMNAGAVLAEASYTLQDFAKDAGYRIIIDQSTPVAPVIGHKETFKTMMVLLGASIVEAGIEHESIDRRLVFGVHKSAKGIIVGAFHSSLELTQDVIKLNRQLHGSAKQAAPALGAAGGAGLAIADSLSQNLGSPLKSYRHKSMSGIGSIFQPTQQLQLL